MADKHILRIHDTQANLIAELKDKQIAWATDINEAIWRNGTNFHFLSSGKYWDGTQFVFDNIDAGKVSLFDRTAGTILGELDADAGTFTINFAGSPIVIDATTINFSGDLTANTFISSSATFQGDSANVSLTNNTLVGVTFYGATQELNSTGGVLRLGNSLMPIEQQFLKATDKGAVYTGLKMLAKDTTTNEVFMADVPSGGGGGGQVDSITSSDGNIDIDSSDPVNPDINLFRFPNNKLASDAPDTYPEGYSYGLNAGSGGFPDTFGTHQTFKSADTTGYQTFTATNSNQQWVRTITASNTWGSFTEITAGLGAPLSSVLSGGNTTGSTAINYSSFSNASPSNGDVNRDVDEELVYRRSGRNMGLVGSDRAVSTITNMNSLTLAGFYVTTNSGLTNIPSGWASNYLHMLVIRHEPTSGAITQIAYNVGESGTAGSKTAIRNSFNGGSSWTSWAELGASGASGTFTSNDGKTITVANGLITSIV